MIIGLMFLSNINFLKFIYYLFFYFFKFISCFFFFDNSKLSK